MGEARRWGVAALLGSVGCTSALGAPPVEALCGRQCAHLETAGCGTPMSGCDAACVSEAARVPVQCVAVRDARLRCRAVAAVQCDVDGEPSFGACNAEEAAYAACTETASEEGPASAPERDAGRFNGDAETGDAETGDAETGDAETGDVEAVPDDAEAAGAEAAVSAQDAGGTEPSAPDAGAVDGGDGSTPPARLSCSEVCKNVQAAACKGAGACGVCEELRIVTPDECAPALSAMEQCAAHATFTCDAQGDAVARACDPVSEPWSGCVTGRYPNAFGVAQADPALCTALAGGDSCSTCIAAQCCSEFAQCLSDSSCAEIVTCTDSCASGDFACVRTCEVAHPGGTLLYVSLFACALTRCAGC